MDEELKACPFCGGAAKRITLEDADNFGGDVITCSKCDCCTRVVFGEKDGLVESWNRRAQLPSQGGEAVAGTLHISHFRDNPAMENVDFQLIADLKPGSYKLYTRPADHQEVE